MNQIETVGRADPYLHNDWTRDFTERPVFTSPDGFFHVVWESVFWASLELQIPWSSAPVYKQMSACSADLQNSANSATKVDVQFSKGHKVLEWLAVSNPQMEQRSLWSLQIVSVWVFFLRVSPIQMFRSIGDFNLPLGLTIWCFEWSKQLLTIHIRSKQNRD